VLTIGSASAVNDALRPSAHPTCYLNLMAVALKRGIEVTVHPPFGKGGGEGDLFNKRHPFKQQLIYTAL